LSARISRINAGDEALVVIHPADAIRQAESLWVGALLFDAVVTFIFVPEQSKYEALRGGKNDVTGAKEIFEYWEATSHFIPLINGGILRPGPKGARFDEFLLDVYQWVTQDAGVFSPLFRAKLPVKMPRVPVEFR
jgi:hypothetical protein